MVNQRIHQARVSATGARWGLKRAILGPGGPKTAQKGCFRPFSALFHMFIATEHRERLKWHTGADGMR